MRRQYIDRTEHYRKEASACAAAAATAAIAEVKQAYLELEQGWLCLSPKPGESLHEQNDAQPGSDGNAAPSSVPEPDYRQRKVRNPFARAI